MKKISFPIASLALALIATALSFGQTQTGATAVIPSVYYEILDQPDCPLNISIDERLAARIPAATLKITNNHSSTVNAFVLHLKNGSRNDYSNLVFLLAKGITPGEFHTKILSVRAMADGANRPVFSLDYVHFADGKTWGADSLGRSVDVKSYLGGHDLAISRLKELLAGQDDTDFMKAVARFGSSSFGEADRRPRSPRRPDYFAKGYQGIIDRLRRMSKRADEAKKFARDLELMENDRQP